MKLELFDIIFNNVNDVHYAGNRVAGEVFIQIKARSEVQGIFIDFFGKAKCGWTKSSNDNEKKYKAEEIYFGKRVQLVGTPTGRVTEVCAGRHRYSFSMLLPPTLPSSFEGRKGYVRYFCKVTIDRPRKFSKSTKKRLFTVIHHLDLNSVRNAAVPTVCERDLILESWCCTQGLVVGQLMLNKTGYVPGEPMIYTIDVCNRSNSSISRLDLELRQFVTYTGYSSSIFSNGNPKQHTKMEEITLLTYPCRIKRGMEERLNRGVIIPALPPSGLEGCGIIDIQYVIVLRVHIGWNMRVLTIAHEVIIGTIPVHSGDAPPRNGPSSSGTSSIQPPPYTEPPPSYDESVFGRRQNPDDDDDHDEDDDATDVASWAPSYPIYNWDQPPPSPPLDGAPITAQPGPSAIPTEPPPPYNQI